jgi:rifampicin phosphotransferase
VSIWFLDDDPSARFPVYSRGNVGEITPNVTTPLTATITTGAFSRAFGELFASTGAFRQAEVDEPAATGGVFGGYLYFNVSFARAFAARMPGMRVPDVDRQLFGGADGVPPFRRGPGDRSLAVKLRAGAGMVRMLVGRQPLDLDGERAETKAWLASLPASPTRVEAIELAARYEDRFTRSLRSLLAASMGSGLPTAMLEKLARRAEANEPGLLVKALSGLGAIETAGPAVAMWRLGRMVAASPSFTAAFDKGVDGVLERLAETDFAVDFQRFLDEHGHRGPNEVELASDTWATAPSIALAAVERLRMAPASADPVAAGSRLASERAAARDRMRRGLPWGTRRLAERLLNAAARGAANREQAKGTLVLDLFGLRRMLFRLADGLVAEGALRDRGELFMAQVSELPALVVDPAPFRVVLAERRRRYDELNALVPPFAFEGRIPDPSTWASRADPVPSQSADVLTGIGVSSGVAKGIARVVLDPADPRGLGPGDVLVAPITDPAWTPLFLAASAVVVNVGALQSHAAIVARELGIPAVVSVDAATSIIADGDELEVDGDRGVVRINRVGR